MPWPDPEPDPQETQHEDPTPVEPVQTDDQEEPGFLLFEAERDTNAARGCLELWHDQQAQFNVGDEHHFDVGHRYRHASIDEAESGGPRALNQKPLNGAGGRG